ncbi:cytochrome c [bacterium AH-315-J21]|nr:cytochrome c [bacterium AH-315-J21]
MTKDRKILHIALLLGFGGIPVAITVGIVIFFHQPTTYRCPMYIADAQMSQLAQAESSTKTTSKRSSQNDSPSTENLSVLSPAAVKLGAGIFEESCASCHGQTGQGDAAVDTKLPVPPKDLNSWAVQWRKDTDLLQAISDHDYVTPLFSAKFSDEERWGLVHYIRKTFAPSGSPPWNSMKFQSAEKLGRTIFETLDCNRCHRDDRPRELAGFPPTLDHVGSKLKRDWIVEYLLNPYPIRWATMGIRPLLRMPSFKFERSTAEAVADYLSMQVDTVRFPETALKGQGNADEGRSLFKSYQCLGCHSLQGEGNKIGPDLTKAGDRLKPAYIFQWVKDPQGLIPGTGMKDFELWDDEASSLVRYVETLK